MLHAVIMAGGSGTRFWPESRGTRPKQLLPIMGSDPMLTETVARLDPLIPAERTWVVTTAPQVEGVRRVCPDLPAENILVEPCARNTSACVGLAAAALHAVDPEATMAVLPADHVIGPKADFQRSLLAGAEAAATPGTFVTFGIKPTYPATGYGYIRRAGKSGNFQGIDCFAVDQFTEKPDATTALSFVNEGVYFWNAGIFVWTAKTILSAMATHMPELIQGLDRIQAAAGTEAFEATLNEVYPTLPAEPVDIGIMEKVDNVQIMIAPYKWSDVGSWKALYDELAETTGDDVAIFPAGGELLTENAKGTLAYSSSEQTIAVLGLDDVVVVHTKDAILVAHRDKSEDVKAIVNRLRESGRDELL
ncbi:MAG: NTP transferase domain-containing protein [Planctomycetes bacterium]|jgi:mannose-1-phosphate guanylyltransferase|nr:NTP transferase domain-containing protein [Planctomycetota bacterium]MBT4560702.1 NTP transferase domain-containing protein [Planctomycetota bacterium]MBT7318650.1 NTP transferase domain-containing protein [Planctomycetota bacterium]